MTKRLLPCFCLLLIILTNTYCQDSTSRIINNKSAGLLVEYGQPFDYLPEGTRYYFTVFGANLHIPLYKTIKSVNLSIDIYPNYVYVWLVDDDNYYEYGLNIRLGLNYLVKHRNMFSLKLGCGPHYITAYTERQANGFIFSDYILLGYTRALGITKKLYALEFEFGYRHLSNAGLTEPNKGISSIIFGLGFYKTF